MSSLVGWGLLSLKQLKDLIVAKQVEATRLLTLNEITESGSSHGERGLQGREGKWRQGD